MRAGRSAAMAAAAVACLAVADGGTARPLPGASACPVFPRTSQWNARVDKLPAHAQSGQLVRSVGLDANMHADFGSGRWEGAPIGIPYVTVRRARRGYPFASTTPTSPTTARYPIPRGVPVEGGRGSDGDRHVIVVDRSRCRLYELFAAYPETAGALARRLRRDLEPAVQPAAAARMDLGRRRRPADPARPRALRRGARGRIDHALRFTAPRTRSAFVYPARHSASSLKDPALPAMGQRFRLKSGFDVSRFPRQARIVLRALKRYGMILADNGSPWYVSGAPNRAGTMTTCTPSATSRAARSRPWTRALCRARDAE